VFVGFIGLYGLTVWKKDAEEESSGVEEAEGGIVVENAEAPTIRLCVESGEPEVVADPTEEKIEEEVKAVRLGVLTNGTNRTS